MNAPWKRPFQNASVYRRVFALVFCVALCLTTAIKLYNWGATERAEMERTGYWGVTGAVVFGGLVLYPVLSVLIGLICGAHKRLGWFLLVLPATGCMGIPELLGELSIILVYEGLYALSIWISRKFCQALREAGCSDAYVEWLFVFVAVFVILCGFLCYYAATDHPRRWALTAFLLAGFFGLLGWLAPAWENPLRTNTIAPPAVVLLFIALVQPMNWLAALASGLACWGAYRLRMNRDP